MDEDLEVTDDQIETETSGDVATDKVDKGAELKAEVKPEIKGKTKDEAKPKEKSVVPEKYDLKLPEDSLLAPSLIDKISAYAREKGLSNEAAQELLDEEVEGMKAEQQTIVEEVGKRWIEESKADKEIAGIEGKDYERNVQLASQVVAHFDPEGEIRKMLNRSRIGNNPEVIKMFLRIGKAMGDDKFVHSKTQSRGERPLEEVFYGETKGG